METLLKDIRYSFRRLARNPGFTAIVALTLALGIGANAAIFSVVNGFLLRPLPYKDPDRLVSVNHHYPSLNNLKAPVSALGFRHYRDNSKVFDGVAVESATSLTMTGEGDPQRISASRVSAQYFSTMGIPAAHGRVFLPEEDQQGRPGSSSISPSGSVQGLPWLWRFERSATPLKSPAPYVRRSFLWTRTCPSRGSVKWTA
ncbi:MAG: ABC transporter permease [Acidobacteriota bacterium]